ncbi:MAG: hypothetical protein H6714_00235 [Myxococcales bacterium]|nr:hypothetical protein [Myxococcales bacterium]
MRPAGAISNAAGAPSSLPNPSPSGGVDALEINGVVFHTRAGGSRRSIEDTLKWFAAQCESAQGDALPATDRNHGFVLCSYPTLDNGDIKVRLAYVRGDQHGSTYTELWSTEPFAPQQLSEFPTSAPIAESGLDTKFQASSGSLNLAVLASAMDPARLVTQKRRELEKDGWHVNIVALAEKRFVLDARHGRHSKTLVISEHSQWNSVITAFDTKKAGH